MHSICSLQLCYCRHCCKVVYVTPLPSPDSKVRKKCYYLQPIKLLQPPAPLTDTNKIQYHLKCSEAEVRPTPNPIAKTGTC